MLVLWDRARAGNEAIYADQIIDPATAYIQKVTEGLRLRVSEIGRLMMPGMYKAYGKTWIDANLLFYVPFAVALTIGWSATRR